MRQKTCSACGDLHDMDDAICPHCGRRLMELYLLSSVHLARERPWLP